MDTNENYPPNIYSKVNLLRFQKPTTSPPTTATSAISSSTSSSNSTTPTNSTSISTGPPTTTTSSSSSSISRYSIIASSLSPQHSHQIIQQDQLQSQSQEPYNEPMDQTPPKQQQPQNQKVKKSLMEWYQLIESEMIKFRDPNCRTSEYIKYLTQIFQQACDNLEHKNSFEFASILFNRAIFQSECGDDDDAKGTLKYMKVLKMKRSDIYILLARLEMKSFNYSKARSNINRGIQKKISPTKDLEEFLKVIDREEEEFKRNGGGNQFNSFSNNENDQPMVINLQSSFNQQQQQQQPMVMSTPVHSNSNYAPSSSSSTLGQNRNRISTLPTPTSKLSIKPIGLTSQPLRVRNNSNLSNQSVIMDSDEMEDDLKTNSSSGSSSSSSGNQSNINNNKKDQEFENIDESNNIGNDDSSSEYDGSDDDSDNNDQEVQNQQNQQNQQNNLSTKNNNNNIVQINNNQNQNNLSFISTSTSTSTNQNNVLIDPQQRRSSIQNQRANKPPVIPPPSKIKQQQQQEAQQKQQLLQQQQEAQQKQQLLQQEQIQQQKQQQQKSSMPPPQQQQQQPQQFEENFDKQKSFEIAKSWSEVAMVNNKPYLRIEFIGKGGSGKVYKVLSHDLKIYALKYVCLRSDQSEIEAQINEIEMLKRLKKRINIIQLIDYEVNISKAYILLVLEFGEIDLSKLLQRLQTPTNVNFIRIYWQQMLQAVHTIHEEKIIHGDLKPANFVSVQGCLKLIDFGIAKAIQSDDTTNIIRDSQIGTINYISPEALIDTSQGAGSKQCMKLGRASDIWSLGCILYEMAFGYPPFKNFSNMFMKYQAIINPNHVIEFPVHPNENLLNVLKLCLKRNPQERPTIPKLLEHDFLKL